MIFVTVGTQFPFDRLVRAVDDAAGRGAVTQELYAQIGVGGYRPRNMEWVETLERDAYVRMVGQAEALVAHAGTGTILDALAARKPVLVLPRLRKYREAVNDHQAAMARKFASLGYVLMAADASEITDKIQHLAAFMPKERKAKPEGVIERVRAFLGEAARSSRGH